MSPKCHMFFFLFLGRKKIIGMSNSTFLENISYFPGINGYGISKSFDSRPTCYNNGNATISFFLFFFEFRNKHFSSHVFAVVYSVEFTYRYPCVSWQLSPLRLFCRNIDMLYRSRRIGLSVVRKQPVSFAIKYKCRF